MASPPPDEFPSPSPAPPLPPPPLEGSTSPPPLIQIPPIASPPLSPLPQIPPSIPPSPSNPVPPIAAPPQTSSAPIVAPIVSPPPLVAAPPPTDISTPINPVSSPSLPKPPTPPVAPPPLPRTPISPPPPSLSQPGTTLPPLPTPLTPKVAPPPPPLRTPFTPPPPPARIIPREPPTPPTSAVKPPSQSLPSVLHVISKQSHFSSGLLTGCIISVVFFLVLGLCCISCKNRRRRRRYSAMIQQHIKEPPPPPGLKPKALVFSEDGSPKRQHDVRVQISSSTGSPSRNSGHENPSPIQALHVPYVAKALSTGTFTFDELVVATYGFSAANLIGEGGFGYVHKGFLRNGQAVAVKQLKEGSTQGEREFEAEIEIISRIHHKHLASLIGYCITGNNRLLVYEFVPNNTLKFHLHENGQNVMQWSTRLKIAIGSAKGLAYIHEDCNPTIIHRDIKAANILLDHNFEAKVSDFGLAKCYPVVQSGITHISTRVMGTFGYLAPEYATSGKLTEKSDVYSYGVILLELITGCPPISDENSPQEYGLVAWARPLLAQALEYGKFETLVDPRLEKNYNANEMASMVACAAACVRQSYWLRPRMSQIARVLEGDISIMALNGGMQPGHSIVYAYNSSS